MINKLLAYIAPHLCCGCGYVGTLLCDSCIENIVETPIDWCAVCSRPASASVCSEHRTSIAIAACGGVRDGALEQLIDLYKFEYAKAAARPLASLILARLPVLPSETVVVPIPTIAPHIRQRGYDQTLLLAREIARRRDYRVTPVLQRRANSVQRDASRQVRERQAAAAFMMSTSLDPSLPYLLVDDVATTGATLRAGVRALRQAGAATVYVAVAARQPLDEKG